MCTPLLNVKWFPYILDNVDLSSEYYFIRLSEPYFSYDWLLYIHSFVFKWSNLNYFPSLCDCHSLSTPITVKRFQYWEPLGVFLQVWLLSLYKSKVYFHVVWEDTGSLILRMSDISSWALVFNILEEDFFFKHYFQISYHKWYMICIMYVHHAYTYISQLFYSLRKRPGKFYQA